MRFAQRIAKRTRRTARLRHEMPFYKLDTLELPAVPATGRLRPAEGLDRDWLVDRLVDFAAEAGLPEHERGRQHIEDFVRSATEKRRIFVWELPEGRPAATASFTLTGMTGARIGRVMTMPSERRRGIASAAVAALSQHILNGRIAQWCGLFADAKNPQSNRIYQRLGYREACRYRSVELV